MARAIGLAQGAQRVAPAVGPVVGSLLAAAFGLRSAFLVSSAVYLAALVIVSTMYSDPGRTAPIRAAHQDRVTFGNILALENFVLLMVVIFGLQVVDRGFGPVLLLHLGELGYGSGEAAVLAGVLFSVLAVSAAAGNHVAARAITGTTARAAIVRAALVAAGALSVFMLARQTWLLVVTIGVFGAAAASAMTTAFSAAGSVIPREAHGASFGLLSSASLVGSAVSPLIAGLVASQSIRMVFVAGVVLLVVLALVVRGGMITPADRMAPIVDEG
jgi:DHA1 family multidrug resistance protein-like MFS transporter